jgi:transcriptional regulator GlxA family with amidase domain
VRQVERYIEDHAHEPIGLDDLVAAGGVSARAIYEGFQRFRGVSPMASLRAERLRRARAELVAGGEAMTVAAVATRWYFFELGRFAGQYRGVYGETPSRTLRRAG